MSVLSGNRNQIYFHEIDSLRFLAFLIVFLGHAWLPITAAFSQLAWFGVELFFLISGFLLTRILYEEYKESKSINLKFYFIRRILRIWPLYFSFIILLFFLSVKIFRISYSFERLLGNIFFVDNIFTVSGWTNTNSGSGHLWTISVEEQYYFILPFLALWLFRKTKGQKTFFFIAAFLLLLIGKSLAVILKAKYPFVHVLPLSADSFLMGILIGTFYNNQTLSHQRNHLLLCLGIILLFIVLLLPSKNITGFHLLLIYPLQAIGFAFILICVLTGRDYPLNKLLRNKALVYLGKISFGLYIFHFPVIVQLAGLFNTKEVLMQFFGLLLMFLVTLILSLISYYLVEKPFLSFKKKFQIVPSGEQAF